MLQDGVLRSEGSSWEITACDTVQNWKDRLSRVSWESQSLGVVYQGTQNQQPDPVRGGYTVEGEWEARCQYRDLKRERTSWGDCKDCN